MWWDGNDFHSFFILYYVLLEICSSIIGFHVGCLEAFWNFSVSYWGSKSRDPMARRGYSRYRLNYSWYAQDHLPLLLNFPSHEWTYSCIKIHIISIKRIIFKEVASIFVHRVMKVSSGSWITGVWLYVVTPPVGIVADFGAVVSLRFVENPTLSKFRILGC